MAFARTRRPLTPARYLAAGCIAVVLFTLICACHVFVLELGQSGAAQALESAVVWAAIAGGVAVFAAIFPGIPLIIAAHLLLRRHPHEALHIAVFALIGCLTAALTILVFPVSGPIVWTLIVGTGAATAMGRWFVGRENITWRGGQPEPNPG